MTELKEQTHREFFNLFDLYDLTNARLVLKIQNLYVVVSLLKGYTIFFTIHHPVLINYVLLLIKTIQL